MKPGLVSSAAYEIQLTADCELPRHTRSSWSFKRGGNHVSPAGPPSSVSARRMSRSAPGVTRSRLRARARAQPSWTRKAARYLTANRPEGLEKSADGLAGYAEADDLARGVDVRDRVGGDQAASS